MKPLHPSDLRPPPDDRLVASLDGPSKTITVEPVEMPVPAPRVEPEREREPAAPREPERPREPAR
jgi:hypothetical protein